MTLLAAKTLIVLLMAHGRVHILHNLFVPLDSSSASYSGTGEIIGECDGCVGHLDIPPPPKLGDWYASYGNCRDGELCVLDSKGKWQPFDVPAVKRKTAAYTPIYRPCMANEASTLGRTCWDEVPVGEAFTCSHPDRILLTSESGERHCLLLPLRPKQSH